MKSMPRWSSTIKRKSKGSAEPDASLLPIVVPIVLIFPLLKAICSTLATVEGMVRPGDASGWYRQSTLVGSPVIALAISVLLAGVYAGAAHG
ncbi:hypothetical protein KCP70_05790 [Salmonella enterica subsp. enterica]|nr:hypothetical protein KCP70_05790 [Salmonella enterica subsp. enterica]